jgi:hypothetical protein
LFFLLLISTQFRLHKRFFFSFFFSLQPRISATTMDGQAAAMKRACELDVQIAALKKERRAFHAHLARRAQEASVIGSDAVVIDSDAVVIGSDDGVIGSDGDRWIDTPHGRCRLPGTRSPEHDCTGGSVRYLSEVCNAGRANFWPIARYYRGIECGACFAEFVWNMDVDDGAPLTRRVCQIYGQWARDAIAANAAVPRAPGAAGCVGRGPVVTPLPPHLHAEIVGQVRDNFGSQVCLRAYLSPLIARFGFRQVATVLLDNDVDIDLSWVSGVCCVRVI